MANKTEDCTPLVPRLAASIAPPRDLGGRKAALALGMIGSGATALVIGAPWSIALAGVVAVLALSAIESETFLLFVVFLMPFAWLVKGHNVLLALHAVVVAGFFTGRLLRGSAHIRHLLHPTISRASLLFWCSAAVPIVLKKGELTLDSARSVYELATYVGFYFVVLAWMDSRERIRKVLWLLLLSTVVTAVFALYQQITGGFSLLWLYLMPPDEYTVPWAGRSPSFLGHPNSLAFYLGLVLPFALACYVRGPGKWKKLGGWTFGLGFLALLSTQSIGGILAFVAILVLAIFCFARNRKRALVLLAGLCALVCLLYLLRSILNPAHSEEAVGPDVVMRLVLWGRAWDFFMHSPLMGVGWGNFVQLYGSDLASFAGSPQAGVFEVHNVYLQLLAETGLVGFAAFFYLIAHTWRQARRQLRSSLDFFDLASAFGVLGALLSLLVHGFIDVPFFAQFGTLFWVLLALLVAIGRLRQKPGVWPVHAVGAS